MAYIEGVVFVDFDCVTLGESAGEVLTDCEILKSES
jgi:hypothetical protein